jgi:hypothetical protein
MSGADLSPEELYRQICLTADEYVSFRNQMMQRPYVTVTQIEGALRRGDKLVGLLRMLRAKQAVASHT